jgi:hypothetical protein
VRCAFWDVCLAGVGCGAAFTGRVPRLLCACAEPLSASSLPGVSDCGESVAVRGAGGGGADGDGSWVEPTGPGGPREGPGGPRSWPADVSLLGWGGRARGAARAVAGHTGLGAKS